MQKDKLVIKAILFLIFLSFNGATITAKNWSEIQDEVFIHPVHLSVTTIEYNENEKNFMILFRIFVDDFDLILKEKYGKDLELKQGKWDKNYLKIIDAYLLTHFNLTIDGKDLTKSSLKFERQELKEQAIWLYYTIENCKDCSAFSIYNSLMTDLFLDQNNLLIFAYKGEEKALKFDVNNTKQEFSL